MLTGDEVMTTGEAYIDNISLKKDKSKYLQSIGYCPQFDSIIEVNRMSILVFQEQFR
jgi:ATP-binding cassette subfamily A (ABC1) protein 3